MNQLGRVANRARTDQNGLSYAGGMKGVGPSHEHPTTVPSGWLAGQ